VPAALIVRGSHLTPIASLALAALTYGLTYAALSFTVWRRRWHAPVLDPAATA
jgi:hypothetical protein